MLNWLLAFLTFVLWGGCMAWYYFPELKGMWNGWRTRRADRKG